MKPQPRPTVKRRPSKPRPSKPRPSKRRKRKPTPLPASVEGVWFTYADAERLMRFSYEGLSEVFALVAAASDSVSLLSPRVGDLAQLEAAQTLCHAAEASAKRVRDEARAFADEVGQRRPERLEARS